MKTTIEDDGFEFTISDDDMDNINYVDVRIRVLPENEDEEAEDSECLEMALPILELYNAVRGFKSLHDDNKENE